MNEQTTNNWEELGKVDKQLFWLYKVKDSFDNTNPILIDALNNNGALKIYGSDALKVIDFTIEMLENKKKDLLVKLGQ